VVHKLRRFTRKDKMDVAPATKQHDGQISKILSSPVSKNIPLTP
jgi:hypothetical protein